MYTSNEAHHQYELGSALRVRQIIKENLLSSFGKGRHCSKIFLNEALILLIYHLKNG